MGGVDARNPKGLGNSGAKTAGRCLHLQHTQTAISRQSGPFNPSHYSHNSKNHHHAIQRQIQETYSQGAKRARGEGQSSRRREKGEGRKEGRREAGKRARKEREGSAERERK